MATHLNQHFPRFEQRSLFFYALLGVVSFAKKLENELKSCVPVPPLHSEANAPRAAVGRLDYLLLGLESYRVQVLRHIATLAEEGDSAAGPADSRCAHKPRRRAGILR